MGSCGPSWSDGASGPSWALNALDASGASGPSWALNALDASGPSSPSGPSWTLNALNALDALDALSPCGPCGTLETLSARCSCGSLSTLGSRCAARPGGGCDAGQCRLQIVDVILYVVDIGLCGPQVSLQPVHTRCETGEYEIVARQRCLLASDSLLDGLNLRLYRRDLLR